MSNITALTIGPGSEVTMNFSVTLKDGTVADASDPGEPMVFIMGDGALIEGLELALYGLKVGDKQCLEISPQDAFGFPDENNIYMMPRSEFAADLPLEPGTILSFSTPSELEIPGVILAVQGEEVRVDFNHPLAGLPVIFAVEILAIKPCKSF